MTQQNIFKIIDTKMGGWIAVASNMQVHANAASSLVFISHQWLDILCDVEFLPDNCVPSCLQAIANAMSYSQPNDLFLETTRLGDLMGPPHPMAHFR